MSYYYINEHGEKDTSLAKDKHGIRVFIDDVISGKRGYWCIGCDGEMVAVKPRDRMAYFRHYATELIPRRKCFYSDVEERYKIAKESFVINRRIKVPSIYKDPPPGATGLPYRISNTKVIQAHQVAINRFFYINEDENIEWGDETILPELKFLAKADVVFLDQADRPFLLIFFVEKHHLQKEQKANLHILGIDAVQVAIPRSSPEEITAVYTKHEKTKWLFNNDYERTPYIPVSGRPPGEVFLVDNIQGKFLEENFYCRRAQIARIIRQITRTLGSPSYLQTAERIGVEISRIDRLTSEERKRFEDFEKREARSVQAEFESEEREVEQRRAAIQDRKKILMGLYPKFAEIYRREQSDFESNRTALESRIKKELGELGFDGTAIDSRKREVESEIKRVESEIKRIDGDIQKRNANIERIQRDTESIPKRAGDDYQAAVKQIATRSTGGNTWYSGRINEILELGRVVDDFKEKERIVKRYYLLNSSLKKHAYKNWVD